MAEENKTAVDWLISQLLTLNTNCSSETNLGTSSGPHITLMDLFKQAKELEKGQHAQTALHMLEHATSFLKQQTTVGLEDEFNNYFSQTYGGDNE